MPHPDPLTEYATLTGAATMLYALQLAKPAGDSYLVRYQSQADGGRLDAFCGPLDQSEYAQALNDIADAPNWEYTGFEDNDEYIYFETAVVSSPARAWYDADTGETWSDPTHAAS